MISWRKDVPPGRIKSSSSSSPSRPGNLRQLKPAIGTSTGIQPVHPDMVPCRRCHNRHRHPSVYGQTCIEKSPSRKGIPVRTRAPALETSSGSPLLARWPFFVSLQITPVLQAKCIRNSRSFIQEHGMNEVPCPFYSYTSPDLV